METSKSDFDSKIETLLYFKHGLLSVKEYLDFISENEDDVVSVKFDGNNFKIKSYSNREFDFKVYK